jgi:molybdenum cofactor cytidylyltransferase
MPRKAAKEQCLYAYFVARPTSCRTSIHSVRSKILYYKVGEYSLEKIDAILMASGFSARFGEADKLLYPFRGKVLASHTLSLVLSIREFCSVIFVAANPSVASIAEGKPVTVVRNERPFRGQCESIRLGVGMATGDHYAFFPCDQPLLDADTVRLLLANAAPCRIVEPVRGGCSSSPVIFSAKFRGELLSIPDGKSGKWVKRMHPDCITRIKVRDEKILSDIDTLPELERLETDRW